MIMKSRQKRSDRKCNRLKCYLPFADDALSALASAALVALAEGVGEAFVAFEEVLNALVALAVLGGEVFLAFGSLVALADTEPSLTALAEEAFSAFASALV